MPEQTRLVQALRDPACYPHPAGQVRHLETHISHLLLTGQFAYKIKKPLDLGFLDFSTLEKRRLCCEEEVRLNRRLAAGVYLGVVSINGNESAPRIDGAGPVLEYAVRMRQFDPAATLDRLDEAGRLMPSHIDAIAGSVANFHANIPSAPVGSPWGQAASVWQPIEQNFRQIAVHAEEDPQALALLGAIRQWSQAEHARLAPCFGQRLEQGFVRECHGDLHLGNMAWEEDGLLIFDCLEFNPALRWIDVMSEAAFCYMDLLHRNHRDLASRFLNRYLERTGDYMGLELLRYYAVYRALVRAKVAFIRSGQPGLPGDEARHESEQGLGYLRLALGFTQPGPPVLVITHGLSGSGKTTFSQALITRAGMVGLRSDIERKRLAGLDALARSGSGMDRGLYTRDFSRRTYEHMGNLAEALLRSGWSVLADATFIARWQRDLFREIAGRCGTAFHILDFSAPEDVLRQRVRARSAAGNDASEADESVLEQQLRTREPLTVEEKRYIIPATTIDQAAGRL